MANDIRAAQCSVCYAAPGIHLEPAKAMVEVAHRIGPEFITVCLDFDEKVMRMGFGDFAAVEALRRASIVVNTSPGLRTGLVIVDHQGYIFTPTALYLEADDRPNDAPNAMHLSPDQVTEAMARLSIAAKAIAIAHAKTDKEKERIRESAVELPADQVTDSTFAVVKRRLEEAPPVRFDVERQVRVFNSQLQYVELSLTGAAIQRHRLEIPASIQKLGGNKEIEGRLRTTFDLIEKSGKLSSKPLEDFLNGIRSKLTPSLGKDHGRVVLKANKPLLEERLAKLREQLIAHQDKVKAELQGQLDKSRKQIVDYFLPIVIESPPDELRGQFPNPGMAEARDWLDEELGAVIPEAESLIEKMHLNVRYKDVTFETLNQEEFLEAIKAAFPLRKDFWEKAYDEFRAACEKQT